MMPKRSSKFTKGDRTAWTCTLASWRSRKSWLPRQRKDDEDRRGGCADRRHLRLAAAALDWPNGDCSCV